MPNRIIRDSCRTSPNLDSLSDGAERMFWRLTTVADDFGRFQADPRILLAHCFPLKVNCYKTKQIEKWLNELITCELVKTYVCNGVTYGYFVTWEKHQHIRNQKSKFPDPTIDNTCKQLLANVPVIQSNPNENPNENPTPHSGLSTSFENFWSQYPKKKSKGDAEKAWNKLKPNEHLVKEILQAVQRAKTSVDWLKDDGQFIPYPATWLNGKRWEDEIKTREANDADRARVLGWSKTA